VDHPVTAFENFGLNRPNAPLQARNDRRRGWASANVSPNLPRRTRSDLAVRDIDGANDSAGLEFVRQCDPIAPLDPAPSESSDVLEPAWIRTGPR
jgi:hypothetical protein